MSNQGVQWTDVIAAYQAFEETCDRFLEQDQGTLAREISYGLRHRYQDLEIKLALQLEPGTLELVIADLVPLATNHGLTGTVRSLLSRVRRDVREAQLKRHIWPILDKADEIESDPDDEYRRFAELLEHLDSSLLAELVDRARGHGDPNVREVAEDFEAPSQR